MISTALTWLVTWTWQAVALTAISSVVLRLASRANASTRYLVWWITLVGVLALAATPWSWPHGAEQASIGAGGSTPLPLPSSGGAFTLVEIPPVPFWILSVAAVAWLAYSGRCLTTLLRSIVRLRIVKRRCTPLPQRLERRLALWSSVRGNGRQARLCLSEDVATGCMLGLGSPVIALPRGLVAALSTTDLDRVVIHEYGHVQRRDDWATVAQASIEALVGWHPAVWWIGRNLRLEREVACDDWVIFRTVSPRDYASSLTKVAGLALKQPALPFASRALRSRRELISRVERLLDPMRNAAIQPIRSVLATGALALGSVVVLLGQTPPVVTVSGAGTGELPTVPAFSFDAPPAQLAPTAAPMMPQVASRRVGQDAGNAGSTRPQMAADQPEELSRAPKFVNQATLLALVELRAVRGPSPSDSVRSAWPRPRTRPVLRSSEFSVSTEFATSRNLPISRPAKMRSNHMTKSTNPAPWKQIADAGKAVGIGASHAGVATASAFQTVGSSIARVFAGNR